MSDAGCCVVIDMLSLLSEHAPLVWTVYPQLPANIILVRLCYIQQQTFKYFKFCLTFTVFILNLFNYFV